MKKQKTKEELEEIYMQMKRAKRARLMGMRVCMWCKEFYKLHQRKRFCSEACRITFESGIAPQI